MGRMTSETRASLTAFKAIKVKHPGWKKWTRRSHERLLNMPAMLISCSMGQVESANRP